MKGGSLNEASTGAGAAHGHCPVMLTSWAEGDPGEALLPWAFLRQEEASI